MLSLVGLGFGTPDHLTIEGKHILKRADCIYIESYTSKLSAPLKAYEDALDTTVSYVYRENMEQDMNALIEEAKNKHIAVGIIGDVFSATTHSAVYTEAVSQGVTVQVSHNTSIFNAISSTGLQLYKFGKTTSIVAPQGSWLPHSPLYAIKENLERGLHTMCLLDIKVSEDKSMYMSCKEALDILLNIQAAENVEVLNSKQRVIYTKNIGLQSQEVATGTVQSPPIMKKGPLQTLVIPGEMHESEEEMLEIQSRK